MEEDEKGEDRHEAAARIHHKIREEHAGDSAACADYRHVRVRAHRDHCKSGRDSREQIEPQETKVAESFLDCGAEDEEVEHVAGDVQESRVEKERSDEGRQRIKAISAACRQM